MNIFEETYKIEADAMAKYEVAKTEEERNELRNGNEILDFNDNACENDIPEIVKLLRENGITEFTMSSTWSSTVKVCMAFVECGCTLAGMTKIKGDKTCYLTKKNEHEMLPAYVFKVN